MRNGPIPSQPPTLFKIQHQLRKENCMTTHMVICEALTDDLANEVVGKMQEHVRGVPGLEAHSILVEEGGRMVILITDWQNRQDCLAHHAGRAYRQFVAATQHMLVGSYVVKVFANKACLH